MARRSAIRSSRNGSTMSGMPASCPARGPAAKSGIGTAAGTVLVDHPLCLLEREGVVERLRLQALRLANAGDSFLARRHRRREVAAVAEGAHANERVGEAETGAGEGHAARDLLAVSSRERLGLG